MSQEHIYIPPFCILLMEEHTEIEQVLRPAIFWDCTQHKGSPRPARNIRSDSETFAANFVMDWNVHGDKWQSPHWREKSHWRLRNCSNLFTFAACTVFVAVAAYSAGFALQFPEFAPAGDKNVLCRQVLRGGPDRFHSCFVFSHTSESACMG